MAFHTTPPSHSALSASSQPSPSNPSSPSPPYKLDTANVQEELEDRNSANVPISILVPSEDSIALDENFTNFSAAPILPMVPFNLQGKDVSQILVHGSNIPQARSTSLPSSPSKNNHCRDIAELRDEIQRMKKYAFGKELEVPRQSKNGQDEAKNEVSINHGSYKGQFSTTTPSPLFKTAPGSSSFTLCSPLKKDHAKPASPSKYTQNPQHQAHTHPSAEFQIQNVTLPPPPIENQPLNLTKTKSLEFNQKPMVNNQVNLPPTQFENPIISPAHIVDQFNPKFPPLSEFATHSPPKPSYSPTNFPSSPLIPTESSHKSTAPKPSQYKNPSITPAHFFNSNFPPLLESATRSLHEPSHNPSDFAHFHQTPTEPSHNPTIPKPPWTHLFNSNRVKANGTSLEFIPNSIESEGGKPAVAITLEEVSEEICRWRNAIVGYVIGARPPFKLMKQFVERRWKAFGHIELFVLKAGIFIFSFQDEETKQKVLDMGPWSYFDKPLILKPWSPSQSYDQDSCEKIPIWIRLPQLKLHLWSPITLSKLASQVGNPLFTDHMTAMRLRLAYARICVEVNKQSQFPQSIEIIDYDGSKIQQPIEYEWLPITCENCNQFGHKSFQCTKNTKQVWRKVSKIGEDEVKQPAKMKENSTGHDLSTIPAHDMENSITHGNGSSSTMTLYQEIASTSTMVSPQLAALPCATQNKFQCLLELQDDEEKLQDDMETKKPKEQEDVSPLSISPIATQDPGTIQHSASINAENSDTTKYMGSTEVGHSDSHLSSNQKKKQAKMMHAMMKKNKTLQVKSSTSPNSHQ